MNPFICFDKFKDSLSAEEATRIAEGVFKEQLPSANIQTAHLTDGGEGFCKILTIAAEGTLTSHATSGPLFESIHAELGCCHGNQLSGKIRNQLRLKTTDKLGIVEMAQASGLESLPMESRNCWLTSSFGTGTLILKAKSLEVNAILLGVGGSATNDLGFGVLEALGLQFLDNNKTPITQAAPENWKDIQSISGNLPKNLPPIYIACDVQNPLFGTTGAATVYGPQKGLSKEDLPTFEKEARRVAIMLCEYFDKPSTLFKLPGAGAAGGITFGLMAALDAQLLPGFELVSEWLQLDEKLSRCDLLITGEGKFDLSSLQGKGPGVLVEKALDSGKSVTVFAGKIDLPADKFATGKNVRLLEISPSDKTLKENLNNASLNLRAALLQFLCDI